MKNLPNIITLLNAGCGVLAIMLDRPVIGAYLVLAAMILDTLDGLVARILNAKSELGGQLDSLADVISFGVAPAALFYSLVPSVDSLLMAIFYVLSTLFRLAKFNLGNQTDEFHGLPSPAAAGIVAGYVLWYSSWQSTHPTIVELSAIVIPAICMNINLRFFSLKAENPLYSWQLWLVVICTVLAMLINWHYALFTCFLSYLVISIFEGMIVRRFDDS